MLVFQSLSRSLSRYISNQPKSSHFPKYRWNSPGLIAKHLKKFIIIRTFYYRCVFSCNYEHNPSCRKRTILIKILIDFDRTISNNSTKKGRKRNKFEIRNPSLFTLIDHKTKHRECIDMLECLQFDNRRFPEIGWCA